MWGPSANIQFSKSGTSLPLGNRPRKDGVPIQPLEKVSFSQADQCADFDIGNLPSEDGSADAALFDPQEFSGLSNSHQFHEIPSVQTRKSYILRGKKVGKFVSAEMSDRRPPERLSKASPSPVEWQRPKKSSYPNG